VEGKTAPPVGSPGGGSRRASGASGASGTSRIRPSLGGGAPARERELGPQGRQTVKKLLEAGLAEFNERGFQTVRVDDVVRRAKTSHGTFYLYFSSKDDLFRTLLRDALHDMEIITGDFPVVTRNDAGREALRSWVGQFFDTYAAHAPVLRILTSADDVNEEVYGEGLQVMFRVAEAMTQGMTGPVGRPRRAGSAECGAGARRTDRRRLPDDAGTDQLPAQRGGRAAQGRDGGPAQRDHLRGLPPELNPQASARSVFGTLRPGAESVTCDSLPKNNRSTTWPIATSSWCRAAPRWPPGST